MPILRVLEIETITKGELFENLKTKDHSQIVNVLSPEYYYLGFIKGSFKIPESELDQRFYELDKNKEVITYCANYDSYCSSKAAIKLAARGFKVRTYRGGIQEWTESHLPLEEAKSLVA
jgi:rhodanese-related sulfurtransferase